MVSTVILYVDNDSRNDRKTTRKKNKNTQSLREKSL